MVLRFIGKVKNIYNNNIKQDNKNLKIFIFILFIFSLSTNVWSLNFSMGLEGEQRFLLLKEDRFPNKIQIGESANLELEIPLISDTFNLISSFGTHWWHPSSAQDGYIYRGFSGMDIRMMLSGKMRLFSKAYTIQVWGGGSLGASFVLDKYNLTDLYFFYPGISGELFAELVSSWLPFSTYKVSFLMDAFFRKDLTYAFSIGISLGIRFKSSQAYGKLR